MLLLEIGSSLLKWGIEKILLGIKEFFVGDFIYMIFYYFIFF